jgi:transcriptional regulator with XRE-family HTH domain
MLNRNALKAEMVRNGLTQKDVANAIGISEKTFISRMKKGDFRFDEAQIMVDLLMIENPAAIFFAK